MSATSKEIVPSPIPRDDGLPIDPKARAKGKEPVTQNVATLISVLVHGFGMLLIGLSALLAPHRPSTVPVFELVNLEPPKLRPLTPKVQPPPEPPKPEPEPPPPPPEAPKLTPKPTKAVTVKKPEPKVTKPREPEDKTPPKDVVPEQQVLTPQIVSHVPDDARLSLWAGLVKKRAERLWKPPAGIDILGTVKTVVSFKVARDGTIQDVQVGTPSGNSELDQLAQETIVRMGNTPPIPENFPDDQIQVSYEFVYSGQQ